MGIVNLPSILFNRLHTFENTSLISHQQTLQGGHGLRPVRVAGRLSLVINQIVEHISWSKLSRN
jgi:hypothetical protein